MANARITYHKNEHSILFGETGGACPLCASSMMFKKANSKNPTIGYEIAHIYPLNPNTVQATALKSYAVPADINALDNVILLCPSCHTRYDKDFDIKEYLNLLEIKKGYLSDAKARLTASEHTLCDEVRDILDLIASDNGAYEDLKETKLDVSTLDNKLKTGASPLLKRDIRRDVVEFFVPIRDHICLIEQRDQLSVRILQNQINTYYLTMEKQNPGNKDLIFTHISQWISSKSRKSQRASKILTSFFVQNCEVFDVNSN